MAHAGQDIANVDLPLLYELPGGGYALFTTRAQGNMSSAGGIDHEHGHDTRKRLCARLGLRRLARSYQVHGSTVLRIRADAEIAAPDPATGQPSIDADGNATSLIGIGAMALAADCLPVALGCEGAVAMVHAGWRGLVAGVLEEGMRAVRELGGEGEGEVAAVIGPGAGPCCYEVGPEVHATFASSSAGASPIPIVVGAARSQTRTGGSPIDLKAIARERLMVAGVSDVWDVGLCTICDERFFSYRREGSEAGRQAGIAWLRESE
jgi:polyphenol oxidase